MTDIFARACSRCGSSSDLSVAFPSSETQAPWLNQKVSQVELAGEPEVFCPRCLPKTRHDEYVAALTIRKLTDNFGNLRFGKFKDVRLEDVSEFALQEIQSWAKDIARECQEELDRRVAELRASEAVRR